MRGRLYPNWIAPVSDAADPGTRYKAEMVLAFALATAPVDTGEYRSKLVLVELGSGVSGYRIEARADHSAFVEYGTRNMDAYHTLAVALDAANGVIRMTRRGNFRRVITPEERRARAERRAERERAAVQRAFGDEG